MKTDSKRRRVIEYGFLPAGGLEDVTEFWHWMVTNAHAYRGLSSAAEVLSEIGHPKSSRLRSEAESYKSDLLEGMKEAAARSPVVKLRNGTWVPHFPSRPRKRGRSEGWIRETLEGAVHLILCGLVDPLSKEAEWILKDFEDNLYISELYGYSEEFGGSELPDFERYWFSRGGFSMQPNLYGFQIPYLLRDQTKHFLRAFFNSFAVSFYDDTRMLTEHPLPTMANWGGDHFKTSDEAISCYCLRLMLVHERQDELFLMSAVPTEWFGDGKKISVREAATYFGKVSFETESRISEGLIKMVLTPPRRNPPESIVVRFKQPNGDRICGVEVNGQGWSDYDPEDGLVRLGRVEHELDIAIRYQTSRK